MCVNVCTMPLSITVNPAPSAKMYFGLWRFLYHNLWPAHSVAFILIGHVPAHVLLSWMEIHISRWLRVIDVMIMSPSTIISGSSWTLGNRCSPAEELISEEDSKSQQNGTFRPETNQVLMFTHHWTLPLDLLTTFHLSVHVCVCVSVCARSLRCFKDKTTHAFHWSIYQNCDPVFFL